MCYFTCIQHCEYINDDIIQIKERNAKENVIWSNYSQDAEGITPTHRFMQQPNTTTTVIRSPEEMPLTKGVTKSIPVVYNKIKHAYKYNSIIFNTVKCGILGKNISSVFHMIILSIA